MFLLIVILQNCCRCIYCCRCGCLQRWTGRGVWQTSWVSVGVDCRFAQLDYLHKYLCSCERNTTFCLVTGLSSATRDVYTCLCRESYYLPNSTLQGFPGDIVEMSEGYDNYSCIPCPGGCSNCDLNGICLGFQDEEALNIDACLRLLVAIVLAACILCCCVLSVIVFRQRKCKVHRYIPL